MVVVHCMWSDVTKIQIENYKSVGSESSLIRCSSYLDVWPLDLDEYASTCHVAYLSCSLKLHIPRISETRQP